MRASRTNLRLLLACAPAVVLGALGSFVPALGCGQTFVSSAGSDGASDGNPGIGSDGGPEIVTLVPPDASVDAAGDVVSGCPEGELACDSGCIEAGLLNCGACGHDCAGLPHVSGPVTCSASGQCSFPLSSCAAGWTHCSSNPDQGCETNLTTAANCGACANACPIAMPVCADAGSGYACIACSAPTPTPCFGSCVDLTSDGTNCGACGHDCQGGLCLGGLCQPVTLATGLDDPTVIAVGPTGVFWTTFPASDAGAVMTCGLDGGPVTTLATETGTPSGIAANTTHVYWADESIGVQECAIGGCGAGPTLVAAGPAKDLAIDSSSVYWIQENPGVGLSCPLAGCPVGADGGAEPTTLFSGQGYTQNLAIDATSIYWSGPPGAFKCPLSGCPLDADGGDAVTVLATTGGYGISVDSANAYWGGPVVGLLACAIGGCGGMPRALAATAYPFNTVSDGINVYWTDYTSGAIDRCAISGCGGQPTVMASGQRPFGIALDSTTIYWTDSTGGTVSRLAK